MFFEEPTQDQINKQNYMATVTAIDSLGQFQTELRSIAMVCSTVGNKNACNEALACSDVVGDLRNTILLLNDKILRDIRDVEA